MAGQAQATRVVARPWISIEDSEFTETGSHRTFTRAALRGVIVKPTVANDGWEEISITGERQTAPGRARRLWL